MNGSTAAGAVVLLVAVGCVAGTRGWLAAAARSAKEHDEIYALPPAAALRAAALGWDAAAVDLLWADLLVQYGTHWSERREFRDVPRYIDAILELEPSYWPVYRYADTILVYRPLHANEDDARRARAYLQRGTRERPNDWRVWLEYGQYLAFIGPSFLPDGAERDAWRKDGALALGRAVDLGGGAESALSAATILTRSGAREQAIEYLRKAYVFTEHPSMADVHEAIGRKLTALEASAWDDAADAAEGVVDARWKHDLPFLSRDGYLLIGPVTDPYRCEGLESQDDPERDRDWTAVLRARGVAEPGSSERPSVRAAR